VISLRLRIDWSELDVFGHVNSLAFLKYVQAARVNYWEHLGLYQSFLSTTQGTMLASVHCDLRRPLHYPGEVIVQTQIAFVKNSSFGFRYELLNAEGETVAQASDVMVSFDFATNQPIPCPDVIRQAGAAPAGPERPT